MRGRRGCANPERLSLNDRTGRYYNLTLMSTVDLKSKTLKLDISRRWILVGGRTADSITFFFQEDFEIDAHLFGGRSSLLNSKVCTLHHNGV